MGPVRVLHGQLDKLGRFEPSTAHPKKALVTRGFSLLRGVTRRGPWAALGQLRSGLLAYPAENLGHDHYWARPRGPGRPQAHPGAAREVHGDAECSADPG